MPMMTTINPSTGEILKQYHQTTPEEVETYLNQLCEGWKKWRALTFSERAKAFLALSKKILEKKAEFSRLVALEMGKPVRLARAEIEKCAWVCEYFAENAAKLLEEEVISTSLKKSVIQYQPMGVILGIMPWNFPFWQVFRAASTSIMAGNVFLLKHAPIATGSALAIEALFNEVMPVTVFKTIVVDESTVSALISHEKIAAVTLTGSVRAGVSVAQQAAQSLKKCVLELGGNDPYLILEDADLAAAAKICVQGRLANAGQVCIAPKRLIVIDSVFDEFRRNVLREINLFACGDPLKEQTTLGPMAREDLRDLLDRQVQESIAKGAQLLIGGQPIAGKGFYYPATVIEGVVPGMPAFDEELFGPVVVLIRAKNEEEAIALANNTPYGLGAGVFTQNIEHGEYLAANRIEAGACSINTIVSSDPRIPFGGIKKSGLGYELGTAGIREFVHMKSIGVA